jgi:hypothetical protein
MVFLLDNLADELWLIFAILTGTGFLDSLYAGGH